MAEGSLVGPRHVLTAAHVVNYMHPFNSFVRVRGKVYDVSTALYHPTARTNNFRKRVDMAMLVLDKPVEGVKPVPLYPGSDEVGKVATIFGSGKTGTGKTGMVRYDGRPRVAHNKIEKTSDRLIEILFDAPGKGLPDEGVGGEGDSGGPAYILHQGKLHLAGVANKNEPVEGGIVAGYGSSGVYARVSTQRAWIKEVLGGKAANDWGWRKPTSTLPKSSRSAAIADYFAAFNKNSPPTDEAFIRKWGIPKSTPDKFGLDRNQTGISATHYCDGPNNRTLALAKNTKLKKSVLFDFYFDPATLGPGKSPRLIQVRVFG